MLMVVDVVCCWVDGSGGTFDGSIGDAVGLCTVDGSGGGRRINVI